VLEKQVHRVRNVYLVSIVLEVIKMLLRVMHVRKASIRVSKDKDLVYHVFQARTTINSSRPSAKGVTQDHSQTNQNKRFAKIVLLERFRVQLAQLAMNVAKVNFKIK